MARVLESGGVVALRRLAGRLKRTVRGPLLSVVIPCKDAGPYLESAIRSVLNQSLRDLEVIVVDDDSSDESRSIAQRLATRDRRVRPITGRGVGPGAARNDGVRVARGRFLAFVDADDRVLPDAYSDLVSALQASGSDYAMGGYLRHDTKGAHRPQLVTRVHAQERVGTTVAEFPQVLDEPVLWNKVFRMAFWRQVVGSIPEDVNYEDQEPCIEAALGARAIDVLTRDVYSWRLPEGRVSRSQSKAELHDLQDRATVIRRMAARVADAPENVVEHLHLTWLGRDLVMYAEHAFNGVPGYLDLLRELAREVNTAFDDNTWQRLPFWDRLTAWALSRGTEADVAEVVASRLEDTSAVPIENSSGGLIAVTPVLERLSPMPNRLRAVSAADLRLEARVTKVEPTDDNVMVDATAYVPGLVGADQPPISIEVVTARGAVLPAVAIERRPALEADYHANDPWRSYENAGYRLSVPASGAALRFTTNLAGHVLTTKVPLPAPLTPSEDGVLVDSITIDDGLLIAHGTHEGGGQPQVWLVSSKYRVRGTSLETSSGWRVAFDLSDPSLPSGGYFLRWADSTAVDPQGWCRTGGFSRAEVFLEGPVRSVAVRPGSRGEVACTVGPPRSRSERTQYGKRLLIDEAPPPLTPGIFFESFNGKSGGDNPAAILAHLRAGGVDVPMWWSTVDGTIPVPEGATRVTVGTREWFHALRSARVLVTNNNFPHWFFKQPGQYLIQTWHGTPIKRLLFDAPQGFIPLTYRRLMSRQVAQWDLLLAQSEAAAENLRSSSGYSGEVRIGMAPRSARLLAGEDGARRVRNELGLDEDERVVLYAPTWREHLRSHGNGGGPLLDVEGLADALGATVLLRTHHMNSSPQFGSRVRDVTDHPHVEDLFLITDLLISDYSSIFFDFTLTGRPGVVFAPDLEWYRDVERGFYLPDWPSGTPWPLTETLSELLNASQAALDEGRTPLQMPTGVTADLDWLRARIIESLEI